jgi:hypothetical protein
MDFNPLQQTRAIRMTVRTPGIKAETADLAVQREEIRVEDSRKASVGNVRWMMPPAWS